MAFLLHHKFRHTQFLTAQGGHKDETGPLHFLPVLSAILSYSGLCPRTCHRGDNDGRCTAKVCAPRRMGQEAKPGRQGRKGYGAKALPFYTMICSSPTVLAISTYKRGRPWVCGFFFDAGLKQETENCLSRNQVLQNKTDPHDPCMLLIFVRDSH